MINLEEKPDLFGRALQEYDKAFSGDGAPRPFAALRSRSRDAFAALGVPTKRDEAWKYTDLRAALRGDYAFVHGDGTSRLDAEDLAEFAVPGLDAARVVLVNGALVPDLCDLSGLPDGVVVAGLRAAATDHADTVERYFSRYTDVEQDAFAALNSAFDLDGLFLEVPRGVAVERPVHVVHLLDGEADGVDPFVQARHLLVFGEGCEVDLIETHHHAGPAGRRTFTNALTEAVVGAGANVRHVRVQDEGDQAHAVTRVQGYQERDSTYDVLTFTFRSGTVRNNTAMVPDGPGAHSGLAGLYILHGEQHVDSSTLVDHAAPDCTSDELYKGVVYDQSVGVFNGKVFVRRDAQRTNAYQQSQGVVLSPDAKHYSKPELEIYADDVKCSHGSTTGAVDREALFYLRARGIGHDQARALLLYAFAHDVVERVRLEPVRDWLDAKIAERLT